MTHDQLKSAVRQRMAETGEPYTVARREYLRSREEAGDQSLPPGATQMPDVAAVIREAAAAQAEALDQVASAPDISAIERDVAAAQQAARHLAGAAAGLSEVVAAHRDALSLAGDEADLTDAQRDAARQAALDIAASAAGLAEVAKAQGAAFEFTAAGGVPSADGSL